MDTQRRRRRRPALSCVRCRIRKIKCDRKDPCDHCVAARARCTFQIYRDEEAVAQQPHTAGLPRRPPSPVLRTPSSSTEKAAWPSGGSKASPSLSAPGGRRADEELLAPGRASAAAAAATAAAVAAPAPAQASGEDPSPDLLRHLVQMIALSVRSQASATDGSATASPVPQSLETGRRILARHAGSGESGVCLKKARIFRWSDWLYAAPEFRAMFDSPSSHKMEAASWFEDVRQLLQQCKDVARNIKLARPSRGLRGPDSDLTPPPRELADRLAQLYVEAFECPFRIVHIPTFWEEYRTFWSQGAAAPTALRLKILLAMAIGSSLYGEPGGGAEGRGAEGRGGGGGGVDAGLRAMVQQWVYGAQTWLAGPLEKDRLQIAGIQIHCLALLARQILSVGGDLVWVSTGSLVNGAMQIGLHRDPKHLPGLSVRQAELRRRLWATVLELVAQASLDAGMPARVSFDDFDTEPPSNLNDDDLVDGDAALQPHPASVFTQSSLQLRLLASLPTRLRILQLLNDVRSDISYADVLALSAEISDACRADAQFMRESGAAAVVTPLHRNLLDFFVRRFVIPLHCAFALEAPANPLYHYSRKISLDTAMIIASPEPDASFSRLLAAGGGLFREGFRYATSIVALELLRETEAQQRDGTLHRHAPYRDLLKTTVRHMASLWIERIRQGSETNIKGPVFLSSIVAKVEAIEAGLPLETQVAETTKDAVLRCLEILRDLESRNMFVPSPGSPGVGASWLDGMADVVGTDWDCDDFFLGPGLSQ